MSEPQRELVTGDPITLVVLSNSLQPWTILARVVTERAAFAYALTTSSTQHRIEYRHEGYIWIRGHHPRGSNEAQALLAAYILTR